MRENRRSDGKLILRVKYNIKLVAKINNILKRRELRVTKITGSSKYDWIYWYFVYSLS
jgi:hypothetical protein